MIPTTHLNKLKEVLSDSQGYTNIYNQLVVEYDYTYLIGDQQISLMHADSNSLEQALIEINKLNMLHLLGHGVSLRPRREPFSNQIEVVPEFTFKGLVAPFLNDRIFLDIRAELVFESDTFLYQGPRACVQHSFDVGCRQGKLTGGYVEIEHHDNSVTVVTMSAEELIAANQMAETEKYGDLIPYRDSVDHKQLQLASIFRRAMKTLSTRLSALGSVFNISADQMHTMMDLHNRYFDQYRERAAIAKSVNTQYAKRRCVSNHQSPVMALLDGNNTFGHSPVVQNLRAERPIQAPIITTIDETKEQPESSYIFDAADDDFDNRLSKIDFESSW